MMKNKHFSMKGTFYLQFEHRILVGTPSGRLAIAARGTAAVVCPIMAVEKRLNHSVDLHFANPPFAGTTFRDEKSPRLASSASTDCLSPVFEAGNRSGYRQLLNGCVVGGSVRLIGMCACIGHIIDISGDWINR